MSSRWLWLGAALASVVAMSWGGPLFAILPASPPITKAGWRLAGMSIAMTPGFWLNVKRAEPAVITRWRRELVWLTMIGVILGLHMAMFAWSVDHTSFTNSMLLVTVSPIILVVWAIALWGASWLFSQRFGAAYTTAFEDSNVARTSAARSVSATSPLATKPSDVELAALPSAGVEHGWDEQPLDGSVSMRIVAEGARAPPAHGLHIHGDALPSTHAQAHAVPTATPVATDAPTPVAAVGWEAGAASAAGWREGDVLDGATFSGDHRAHARHAHSQDGAPSPNAASAAVSAHEPAEQSLPAHWAARCMVRTTGARTLPTFPSVLEICGTLASFIGMVILVTIRAPQEGTSELIRAQTFAGDVAAFLGAVTACAYFVMGARLRQWMPLWMYTFPVTGVASVTSLLFATAVEGADVLSAAPVSWWGWLSDGKRFGIVVAAALVPGILGHTVANLSLQRVHPLELSVLILLEPAIGGVFGYWLGVQAPPGASTLGGAVIIIAGILMVMAGGRDGDVLLAPFKRLARTCLRPRISTP
ncbi:DMT family transporter [archaeon]|nr:MAG: DMT family transporter [archaeon]